MLPPSPLNIYLLIYWVNFYAIIKTKGLTNMSNLAPSV